MKLVLKYHIFLFCAVRLSEALFLQISSWTPPIPSYHYKKKKKKSPAGENQQEMEAGSMLEASSCPNLSCPFYTAVKSYQGFSLPSSNLSYFDKPTFCSYPDLANSVHPWGEGMLRKSCLSLLSGTVFSFGGIETFKLFASTALPKFSEVILLEQCSSGNLHSNWK